nr:hypothetical protein [Yoonia sp.]
MLESDEFATIAEPAEELERQLMVQTDGPAGDAPVKSSPRPSAQRRMMRSSYMG